MPEETLKHLITGRVIYAADATPIGTRRTAELMIQTGDHYRYDDPQQLVGKRVVIVVIDEPTKTD